MRLPVYCCCLLLLVAGTRGQESVEDLKSTAKPQPGEAAVATDRPADIPKKTTSKPKLDDGGFNLEEALGNDPIEKPTIKPQPGGGGAEFDDSSLDFGDTNAHDDTSGGHDKSSGGEDQGQGGDKQGMLAGIIGAVAAAAVGAVSSFIAYQKKKLCFKNTTDDPENMNMDQKGDPSDPQAQSTLLAK